MFIKRWIFYSYILLAIGYHAQTINASSSMQCPPGQRMEQWVQDGSWHCMPCGRGFYTNANNTCIACPINTYSLDSQAQSIDACKPCIANSTTNGQTGQSQCTCIIGATAIQDNINGLTACNCPAGTQPLNGKCTPCDAGTYSTDGKACIKCSNGKYMNPSKKSSSSAADCNQLCPAGSQINITATGCTLCPQGSDSWEGQPCQVCSSLDNTNSRYAIEPGSRQMMCPDTLITIKNVTDYPVRLNVTCGTSTGFIPAKGIAPNISQSIALEQGCIINNVTIFDPLKNATLSPANQGDAWQYFRGNVTIQKSQGYVKNDINPYAFFNNGDPALPSPLIITSDNLNNVKAPQ